MISLDNYSHNILNANDSHSLKKSKRKAEGIIHSQARENPLHPSSSARDTRGANPCKLLRPGRPSTERNIISKQKELLIGTQLPIEQKEKKGKWANPTTLEAGHGASC